MARKYKTAWREHIERVREQVRAGQHDDFFSDRLPDWLVSLDGLARSSVHDHTRRQALEYLINQAIGKATEKHEIKVQGQVTISDLADAIARVRTDRKTGG